MRTILATFCLFTLIAISFLSCTKDESPELLFGNSYLQGFINEEYIYVKHNNNENFFSPSWTPVRYEETELIDSLILNYGFLVATKLNGVNLELVIDFNFKEAANKLVPWTHGNNPDFFQIKNISDLEKIIKKGDWILNQDTTILGLEGRIMHNSKEINYGIGMYFKYDNEIWFTKDKSDDLNLPEFSFLLTKVHYEKIYDYNEFNEPKTGILFVDIVLNGNLKNSNGKILNFKDFFISSVLFSN